MDVAFYNLKLVAGMEMDFRVLIDERFVSIVDDVELNPIEKKFVIAFLNDFEDGKWREGNFQNFIWDNVAESALTKQERESLVGKPQSILIEAAKNLRLTDKATDPSEGSELAEILLYGIMKKHFKALSVVPKIFYKQNNNDTVKGADSVHIVLNNEGTDFSLWFGEAKFYNSIGDDRLSGIISSVKDLLRTEKLKKENSIVTNISEIDTLDIDSDLKSRIKESLGSRNSIDELKHKINVPILLLHECKITSGTNRISDGYLEQVREFYTDRANSYFKKQIKRLKDEVFDYSRISFHLILFPVPEKQQIVNKFLANAQHLKGQ